MAHQEAESPNCENGHTWTHEYGEDWTPELGTPCDCGKKKWGIPLNTAKEHKWQFYTNGSFCVNCGEQIGSGKPCK